MVCTGVVRGFTLTEAIAETVGGNMKANGILLLIFGCLSGVVLSLGGVVAILLLHAKEAVKADGALGFMGAVLGAVASILGAWLLDEMRERRKIDIYRDIINRRSSTAIAYLDFAKKNVDAANSKENSEIEMAFSCARKYVFSALVELQGITEVSDAKYSDGIRNSCQAIESFISYIDHVVAGGVNGSTVSLIKMHLELTRCALINLADMTKV